MEKEKMLKLEEQYELKKSFQSVRSAFRPWKSSLKSDLGHVVKNHNNGGSASQEQHEPKKSFSSARSAFRPWKPSLKSDLGHVVKNNNNGGSASAEKMLKLKEQHRPEKSFSSDCSAFRPWKPSVKSDLGHVVKNLNNGGSSSAGACVCDQTQQKMDPKRLKRILVNRLAARRSKARKNEYIAHLERMTKSLEDQLCFIHPQIEAYKNKKWLLQIENHQLKLEMAVREKERILEEVEIEKKKVEVNRLMELQKKQIAVEEQTKRCITTNQAENGEASNILPSADNDIFQLSI